MRRSMGNPYTGTGLVVGASLMCIGFLVVSLLPSVQGPACTPRGRVVAGLDALFGEVRRGVAPAGDRSVIEWFASPDTGTWTLLKTLPDGRSCVVATGRNEWRQDPAPVLETAQEI